MIVTLFLPHKIKDVDYGYLYLAGKYENSKINGESECALILKDYVNSSLCDEAVGTIMKKRTRHSQRPIWIEIINDEQELLFETITIDHQKINKDNVTIVYYNSCDIVKSSLLKATSETVSTTSINYFISSIIQTKSLIKTDSSLYVKFIYFITSLISPLLNHICVNLYRLSSFLLNCFDFKSIFLEQLLLRIKQIQTLHQTKFQEENSIIIGRILFIILADVILGIVAIYFITKLASPAELHISFLLAAKSFAGYILGLLHYLKGVPAGLKLNQPVAEALSSFFSYIVYLLLFYLEFASVPLRLLANIFVFVGVLGVTFQAAFLADLLRLSTLHIYCLYIYAARIHMVQLSLLGSHWRGFRGKKWNPLKKRIDSRDEATMRTSVQIFTVVIFTFAIFLLPTTTVYYVVFLMLRLLFLGLQGMAVFFIWALNSNPLYIIWLLWVRSPCINGDICIKLDKKLSGFPNHPLVLELSLSSSSVTKILKATLNEDIFKPCPKPSFSYIWSSLIFARDLL